MKRVTLIIKNAYKSYQHGQFDLLRLHVFDPLCMLAACVINGACLEAYSPPLKQNIPNKSLSLENLNEQIKNLKSVPALEKLKNDFNERFKICPKDKETLWLETIQKLVASEFFELEDAINFGQELENANPNYQQKSLTLPA